ncbi:MAG TPA: hypothetical protein VKU40_17840, partial [Thermoanaerobaculia bacterium]|nr:hypothetical protein [Thermoanaerobaculia bacterium]
RFDVVDPFELAFGECRFYGRGDEAELSCRLTVRNDANEPRDLALGGTCLLIDNQDREYPPAEVHIGKRNLTAPTADASITHTLAPGEQVNVEVVFDTISRQKKKAGVLRIPLGEAGTAEFSAFKFERDD